MEQKYDGSSLFSSDSFERDPKDLKGIPISRQQNANVANPEGSRENYLLLRKLTYPLKNNDWKMKCPFEMVPFQGT